MPIQDFEFTWKELKLSLDWQETFGFYLVLSHGNRYTKDLKERLRDYAREKLLSVVWLEPHSVDDVAALLKKELSVRGEPLSKKPIWISLAFNPSKKETDLLRSKIFSYLNMRRSRLENQYAGPLFIEIPPGYISEVVNYAPDLLSIREKVIELPDVEPELFTPEETEQNFVQEPPAGISDEIIQRNQEIGRLRKKLEGKVRPDLSRQLAYELLEVGKLKLAIHSFSDAYTYLKEAHQIFNDLRKIHVDSPQSLRDVLVVLGNLGIVGYRLGEFHKAREYLDKSIEISRQLNENHGTMESQRDLTVSLIRLGNIEVNSGRLEQARQIFTESLKIARQLNDSQGTPLSQRDLSVSLVNLGRIEEMSGRPEQARQLFIESLEIARQLNDSIGSKESQRDLSVSLVMLGDIEASTGRHVQATQLLTESLEISRQLNAKYGTPVYLRDNYVSHHSLGALALKNNEPDVALEHFCRGLELNQRFRTVFGNQLQACQDAQEFLEDLAKIDEANRGEWTDAKLDAELQDIQDQIKQISNSNQPNNG